MTRDADDDDSWIWQAPRSAAARRSTETPDLRAETAMLVRRRYADLAREGHPAPLDAVRAEVLDRAREAVRTLRPTVACSVVVGIDDALTELELTGDIQAEAARRYPAPLPCPVCGRDDITVTRRGVMRSHNNKLGYWCRGTGQPPAQAPDAPKEVAP